MSVLHWLYCTLPFSLGHTDLRFWKHHKHHHVFHNPSPFSVIADEPVDQVGGAGVVVGRPVVVDC